MPILPRKPFGIIGCSIAHCPMLPILYPFKGDSIEQRVGVLVHRGDVKAGTAAGRYGQYVDGKL